MRGAVLPRPVLPLAVLLIGAQAVLLAGAQAVLGADRGPTLPPAVPETVRARLESVTQDASLAVRVDGEPFAARREIFEYLLDHPEFATHLTRMLRFARYRIWKTAGGLGIDDGWGTVGTFEVVHAAPGTRVMYAQGVYEQRILPDIHGRAVVVIEYASRPGPDGRPEIATSVGGFVKLDSAIMTMAARLASAVARAKGEKEAHRLVKVFAKTTRAVEADPAGVYARLRERPDVPARELEEFRRLLRLPAAASGDAVSAARSPAPSR